MEEVLNLWAISEKVQKQKLRRRFLEVHGELKSKNDFVGFLAAEFGLEQHPESVDDVTTGGSRKGSRIG